MVADRLGDHEVVETFDRGDTLAAMIRTLRAERNVSPRKEVTVHAPVAVRDLIAACGGAVETLAGIGAVLAVEDEVRSDCEYQVQAYGIVNPEEYEAALQECISNNREQEDDQSDKARYNDADN